MLARLIPLIHRSHDGDSCIQASQFQQTGSVGPCGACHHAKRVFGRQLLQRIARGRVERGCLQFERPLHMIGGTPQHELTRRGIQHGGSIQPRQRDNGWPARMCMQHIVARHHDIPDQQRGLQRIDSHVASVEQQLLDLDDDGRSRHVACSAA